MITRQNLISAFLAFAIIAAGFPVLCGHESANQRGAGLSDVVRTIADFSGSAQEPEKFGSSLKKTMAAFYAAAGLTTVITENAPKGSQGPLALDRPFFLLTQTISAPDSSGCFAVCESSSHYNTLCPAPRLRPPKFC